MTNGSLIWAAKCETTRGAYTPYNTEITSKRFPEKHKKRTLTESLVTNTVEVVN